MNTLSKLQVLGSGIINPLGLGVEMTEANIATGISAYEMVDVFDEPHNLLRMTTVPEVAINQNKPVDCGDDLDDRQARMLTLSAAALDNLSCTLPDEPLALFLAGPEIYLDRPSINKAFFDNLNSHSGDAFDPSCSRILNTGRAGAIEAIETAFRYLESSGAQYALVGAVDSFYDYRTMLYLSEKRRLLTSQTMDGFAPGEGAAFLLLHSPGTTSNTTNNAASDTNKKPNIAEIHRPGLMFEKGHLMSKEPYTAEALAKAMQQALSACPHPISTIFSSQTGEMHYTKELSVALIRCGQSLQQNPKVISPAEYFGDLGAAYGLVATALAASNTNTAPASLVYCSSDSGQRAALCVAKH